MTHTIVARTTLVICTLQLLFLAGCAEAPKVVEEAEQPSVVFYPALPNPPRIQYLASFSSSQDLKSDEFSNFGKFILGDETNKDAQGVVKPYGVAMFEGKIYVADTRGKGYAIFDLRNEKYSFVEGSGAGALPKPINITIDTDGTKYITDTVRNQILVFSRDDEYLRAFGVEGQFKPVDVAIAGDSLYVANLQNHNIQVLDKRSGDLITTIGKVGSEEGELYHPTNLAIGPNNHLYVSDTGNFRVQEFSLDGQFIRSIGKIGAGAGSLARPKGIALDHDGNLYVVDAAFENVQIFDSQGELLLFFGEPATNHPSGLDLPTDISIDYPNAVYFQKYADPKFKLKYVILVASQFGRSKVNVYGFGEMEGMSYTESE